MKRLIVRLAAKLRELSGDGKVVRNISWLFLDRVLRLGVGLVVWSWMARYLGAESFGLLNFAIALFVMFSVVAGLGLHDVVVRNLVHEDAARRETLGSAALLLLLGAVIAYFLLLLTIFVLRPEDKEAIYLVAIIGGMVFFKPAEIAAYWFESQVQSKYTVWAQNFAFLFFAGIKAALILFEAPLVAFAWATFLESLSAALLLLAFFNRRAVRLSVLKIQVRKIRALLSDSWQLLAAGLATILYMKIDQIMVGQMKGNEAVGVYSAAVRISEVWYFVPLAIVASNFPAVLDARARGDDGQYYRLIQRLYDVAVWLCLAVAVPMTFLSDLIVGVLFGSAYSAAGPILTIHIWGSVFVFLGYVSTRWFIAENRQVLTMQRTFLGAALNVTLNFVLIPRFGGLGAATATVISYAVANLVFDVFQGETKRMFAMKLHTIAPSRLHGYLRRT